MRTRVEMEIQESGMLRCPACSLEIPARTGEGETYKVRLYYKCPNGCEQEIIYYPTPNPRTVFEKNKDGT